jgi:DNA-binding CsgD family transcriptional regulator
MSTVELTDQEQYVFELFGKGLTGNEIEAILGIDPYEAACLMERVVRLRGTPNQEAIREGILKLKAIRF